MKKLSKEQLDEILGGSYLEPGTQIAVAKLAEAAAANGEVDFSYMLGDIDAASITAEDFCDIAAKAGFSTRFIAVVLRCVDNGVYYTDPIGSMKVAK